MSIYRYNRSHFSHGWSDKWTHRLSLKLNCRSVCYRHIEISCTVVRQIFKLQSSNLMLQLRIPHRYKYKVENEFKTYSSLEPCLIILTKALQSNIPSSLMGAPLYISSTWKQQILTSLYLMSVNDNVGCCFDFSSG